MALAEQVILGMLYFLQDGEIEASGTFDELVSKNKKYIDQIIKVTNNSAKVPFFKDLRAIAMAT